ncbi:MAG: Na+/H+ antiporter subunit C [Pseudomonadota bacterium]|nr:Na+/H+ antiporter subunit C [Pseudomonadota bacterium]
MEALIAITVGMLFACGTYLVLRARSFPVIIGLILQTYAINLFLFASGGLWTGRPPIMGQGGHGYADPLPQALVLTAIVIGFAMTALVVVLSLRAWGKLDTDHVDGKDRRR